MTIKLFSNFFKNLERVAGIEPAFPAWQADTLTVVLYPQPNKNTVMKTNDTRRPNNQDSVAPCRARQPRYNFY